MSVEPGLTLSHYRLIEKIGEGGMGVVWKALDTKLEREVAVKILPEELASDPERLGRFEREAKAVAALNHPNIVTVHSVEEAEGMRFITMELVRGKPLTELIPRNGLPLGKFFDQAVALTEAISAAHQQGITHRDLKPDNVMIGDDGHLKVLDFGLAKLREEARAVDGTQMPTATVTQEGKILGTVSYMSPEQAEGKAIDHRSDIFSLGVMLYQMATGQRPFKGDTSISIISSIMKDTPASITDIKASLPNHLGRIVKRCLAKEPKRRFQTALDLRNELEELGQEVATGKTTAVKATTARSTGGKRTAVWIVGAAIIAILLAVIALQQWRGGRPAEQRAAARPVEAGDAISVAVLPFANMSPDEQNEYFSDGITSEIINYLAKVADLKVIARTSVMQYKDTMKPIRQIGEELGVSSIVEGEVQRVADRVRIKVQLIDAKTEAHLWAEAYDRELTDVFAVQSDVAHKIVTALNATLTPSEAERLGRQPTENLEAYDFYLRGVELGSQSELESDWRMAEQMFVRAVELDPTFAEAHAELSKIHSVLYFYRFDQSEERLAMAREAVDKAQKLGVALAEVHSALGYYYYWGLEDYDNALTHFDAARELEPNDSSSICGIAFVQRRQAKLEQTVENRLDLHLFERRHSQSAENP
jgi:TolB-like protein